MRWWVWPSDGSLERQVAVCILRRVAVGFLHRSMLSRVQGGEALRDLAE